MKIGETNVSDKFLFSGKWQRVERLDCPEDFFKLLLRKLSSAFVNSVKERPHWRPPVWKQSAIQVSWKCFDLEEVKAAFDTSTISLILSKAFKGNDQVADIENEEIGVQAIALAKAKARGQMDFENARPTCRASLVIGEGEGRATREFEIIWWPQMYTNTQRGKIAFRFYVAKVLLSN